MTVKRRGRQKSRASARKRVGKKATASRRNPIRRVNPHMDGAVKMSGNVEAVLYRHAWSRTKAPYRHDFGRGVTMYALRDGSVLLKGQKPLWDMYTVPDTE